MHTKFENVILTFGIWASTYTIRTCNENWSKQVYLEKTIKDLDLSIKFDLEYYADKVTNPELLVKDDLQHRNLLQLKLDEINSWNTYTNVSFGIALGYLTYATYITAKAGIKVASNRYTLWKNNPLAEKNHDLLQRFDALLSEQKEAMVELNLAFKDDKNQFFLHYVCPISMSIIINPVVVRIEVKPNCFKLELYEKSSIIAYLENTKGRPLSPFSRLPLTKCDNQYWTEPNEDIISDHAKYIKDLKNFIDSSVTSSASRLTNP